MAGTAAEWWRDLGEKLEVDIEAYQPKR